MENQNQTSVFQKIFAVMAELPWLEKDGQVSIGGRGGYSYATEAGFIAAVRPLMIKHGLIILPVNVDSDTRPVIISETKNVNDNDVRVEKVSYFTSMNVTYMIVDIDNGESVTIQMAGSGIDSGDKSVYKALTGAFKYVLRQSFMIGTGDDPEASDSDGNNVMVAPITVAAKHFADITGNKLTKEEINAIKNAGYTWTQDFGIPEQRTAKRIRELAKSIQSGKSFEEAMTV